jgi:hypothetical protein
MNTSLQILNINCTYVYIITSPTLAKPLTSLTYPEENILKLFCPSDPSFLLFSLFSNNLLRLKCGQQTAFILINLVAHLFNKSYFLITFYLRFTNYETPSNQCYQNTSWFQYRQSKNSGISADEYGLLVFLYNKTHLSLCMQWKHMG